MVEYADSNTCSRNLLMGIFGDKKKKIVDTASAGAADEHIRVAPSVETGDNSLSAGPLPYNQNADTDADAVRQFDCHNYDSCLSTSAALNWQDFTCQSCDGTIDDSLLALAKSAAYFDPVLSHLGVKHAGLVLSRNKQASAEQRSNQDTAGLNRPNLKLVGKTETPD
jgi:hypothetical protein